MFRLDRDDGYGGVLLYIKDNFSPVLHNFNGLEIIESIWVKVKIRKVSVIVGTIYRVPQANAHYFNLILQYIEAARDICDEMLLMGDLNIDLKNENYNNETNARSRIKDIELTGDIQCLPTSPTRVTSTSSTIIDYIFTSKPIWHTMTEVVKLTSSDHLAILSVLHLKEPQNPAKCITSRNFKHFSVDNFLDDLSNSTIIRNIPYFCFDPCTAWEQFKNEFLSICQKHAPIVKRKVKNRINLWFNQEIMDLMYTRNYYHKLFLKHKTPYYWNMYKFHRNLVTSKVREAKRLFYTNHIKECEHKGPSSMWKAIRNFLPTKSFSERIPEDLNANIFNEHFSQIGQKVTDNIPITNDFPSVYAEPLHNNFELTNIDEHYVYKSLLSLPSDRSLDVLNFDCELLWISAPFISLALSHIFNLTITNGTIPNDFKIARVTPIYKGQGDISNPNNYRPISIISTIGKILEMAIKNQIVYYFSSHNILSPSQFAYIKNRSTQSALHVLVDDFLNNSNNKEITGIVQLDLQKGFDTIPHDILLHKMKHYGISDNALSWFLSYLTDRSQVVGCKGELSNPANLNIGVPQGTILGPIFFIIFVNDLPYYIGTLSGLMYADDTTLKAAANTHEQVQNKLQQLTDKTMNWLRNNRLVVNPNKSSVMLIGTRQKN